MPTVELILTADNTQLLRTLRQTQEEQQKLFDGYGKEYQKKKGLIQQEQDELAKLLRWQLKTTDKEMIVEYNKAIDAQVKKLNELQNAGRETKTQTDSLTQSISKWALSLGGATAALALLKTALLTTTAGINAFNIAGAVAKQVMYNLVTGSYSLGAGLMEVIKAQKELNDLRFKEVIDTYKAKQQQVEYNKYYFEASDRKKTDKERIVLLTQAMAAHNRMIDIETENVIEQAAAIKKLSDAAPGNEKLLMQWGQLQIKLLDLESQRYSGMKRLEAMKTSLEEAEIEKREKIWKDYFDFLEERNAESDKIIAKENEDELKQTLKDVDHAMDLIRAKEKDDSEKRKDALTKDKGIVTVFDFIRAKTALAQKDIGKAIEESFDRLDANSEKGKQLFEDIKQGAEKIVGVIANITDSMAEDATRRRELYDEQIAETQRSLELEAALMEDGFANNVDRKRQEVEELKKLRARALKDEEEAIRKQRIAESIVQGINLATSVTQILKEYTKIPIVGIALAGAAIAALFALFASAKSKSAASTKLAEGGSGTETGIITGRSHAAGGEHFLSHVEVERGERWGVLNRKASDKFGKTFDNIVSSFNKGEMPEFGTPGYSNNVTVNNDGSNSRLDKVIIEQRKLNKQFGGQQVQIVGTRKFITKGNKTRIVG